MFKRMVSVSLSHKSSTMKIILNMATQCPQELVCLLMPFIFSFDLCYEVLRALVIHM